jgi:hypothetical protein
MVVMPCVYCGEIGPARWSILYPHCPIHFSFQYAPSLDLFNAFLDNLKGILLKITTANYQQWFDLSVEFGCCSFSARERDCFARSVPQLLNALVDFGRADADSSPGLCLLDGLFCARDPARAAVYLKRAVRQNAVGTHPMS